MPAMRCSPQAGVHCTLWMSRSAFARRPVLLHADEPLRRGAEDHRRLVAPAMRIAVRDSSRDAAARPLRLQRLDDDAAALRRASCRRRAACRAGSGRRCRTGFDHRQAVALADAKSSWPWPGAVCTAPVPASSVTCSPRITGTCRSWNGCCSLQAFERAAFEARPARARSLHAVALQARLQPAPAASDHALRARAPRLELHQHVLELRAQRHRLVGRQRPGRGGPDHDVDRRVAELRRGKPMRSAKSARCRPRETPRRWPARSCPRIPLPPRPAPSGNRGTSTPASRPCRGGRCAMILPNARICCAS